MIFLCCLFIIYYSYYVVVEWQSSSNRESFLLRVPAGNFLCFQNKKRAIVYSSLCMAYVEANATSDKPLYWERKWLMKKALRCYYRYPLCNHYLQVHVPIRLAKDGIKQTRGQHTNVFSVIPWQVIPFNSSSNVFQQYRPYARLFASWCCEQTTEPIDIHQIHRLVIEQTLTSAPTGGFNVPKTRIVLE